MPDRQTPVKRSHADGAIRRYLQVPLIRQGARGSQANLPRRKPKLVDGFFPPPASSLFLLSLSPTSTRQTGDNFHRLLWAFGGFLASTWRKFEPLPGRSPPSLPRSPSFARGPVLKVMLLPAAPAPPTPQERAAPPPCCAGPKVRLS